MKELKKLWDEQYTAWCKLKPEFQLALLAFYCLIVFGIMGPSLISANSTTAVWIGFVLVVGSGILVGQLLKPLLERFK